MQGPDSPESSWLIPGSFQVSIKVTVEADRLELIESSTPPPLDGSQSAGRVLQVWRGKAELWFLTYQP